VPACLLAAPSCRGEETCGAYAHAFEARGPLRAVHDTQDAASSSQPMSQTVRALLNKAAPRPPTAGQSPWKGPELTAVATGCSGFRRRTLRAFDGGTIGARVDLSSSGSALEAFRRYLRRVATLRGAFAPEDIPAAPGWSSSRTDHPYCRRAHFGSRVKLTCLTTV
jgi:hypothetical protein